MNPCTMSTVHTRTYAEKDNNDLNSNPSDKQSTNSSLEVSRTDMMVYLHNLVHDNIVPEYRIFRMGRHIHEVDIDPPGAHQTASRRSPRNHPATSERPGLQNQEEAYAMGPTRT
jgi:hypothetical protein